MTTYYGKSKVPAGIYFSTRDFSFKVMDKEGEIGERMWDKHIRVPAIAMLVVGPVLGAAYVMFLPAIGFIMLLSVLGGKISNQFSFLASIRLPSAQKWRERLNES